MSETIIRVYEGAPLPDHVNVHRVLLTEDVPWGEGTATRRLLTVLVTDARFWLSDDEKTANPIASPA